MARLLDRTKFLQYARTQRAPWPASSVRPHYRSFGTEPRNENSNRNVVIFWDLDNKPPSNVAPYNAALRLRSVGRAFGFVMQMVAYGNRHAFSFGPSRVRAERQQSRTLDILEARAIPQPEEPHICEVCGRNFKTHIKFQKHFKQVHEREQLKCLRRLDSLTVKRKDAFRAQILPGQEKYRDVARQVLVPKVGYGLAEEIKRAGFWVITASDKLKADGIAMRKHMMDWMERGINCFCLVSDDTDFLEVLKAARARSLRTVVVGDNSGGLKRYADTHFSWREVANGHAQKVAVSTLGLWQDDDVLRQVEWSYRRKGARKCEDKENDDDGDLKAEDLKADDDDARKRLENQRKPRPWWKLQSESEDSCSSSSATS